MERLEQAKAYLNQTMEILEVIEANTETIARLIQKRAMVGLNRVLRERAVLIDELTVQNSKLADLAVLKNRPSLLTLRQAVMLKQQQVILRSGQVVQQAIAEKARIAAELRKSRMQRQVRTQYVNPWAIVARGRRINEKG